MTLLPILRRELCARGRSPTMYWVRVSAAAFGVLVCLPTLLLTGSPVGPGGAGRDAFITIVAAAFVTCCAACLLTADAVSRERREGTLMLLLLTRVSPWDILLAKLGSTGLVSFVSLLAFTPVITLPLMGNGATAGEAARVALALANTLFLALAIGLCASSLSTTRFRGAGMALLLTLGFLVGPSLLGGQFKLLSPFSALIHLKEANYQTSAAPFWRTLFLVHGMGWALIGAAVAAMRRYPNQVEIASRMQDPAGPTEHEQAGAAGRFVQCRYCGRSNAAQEFYCYECGSELYPTVVHVPSTWTLATAPTPSHWLLARQPGFQPMLWIAAAITACKFVLLSVIVRFVVPAGPWYYLVYWTLGFLSAAASASLITYTATRFLAEAQRSGSLEMLLTCPVSIGQWASAQWDFLKRVMALPLMLMLTPTLFQGLLLLVGGRIGTGLAGCALLLLIGAAQTVAGVAALCWLSLYLAFGGMGQARTILWTVVLAEGVPYALTGVWGLFWQVLLSRVTGSANAWASLPGLIGSLVPQTLTLLFSLALIHLARSGVLQQSRPGEVREIGTLIRDALSTGGQHSFLHGPERPAGSTRNS